VFYCGHQARIRVTLKIRFEPRDLWVGLFWNITGLPSGRIRALHLYLCLVPMVPIVFQITWMRKR